MPECVRACPHGHNLCCDSSKAYFLEMMDREKCKTQYIWASVDRHIPAIKRKIGNAQKGSANAFYAHVRLNCMKSNWCSVNRRQRCVRSTTRTRESYRYGNRPYWFVRAWPSWGKESQIESLRQPSQRKAVFIASQGLVGALHRLTTLSSPRFCFISKYGPFDVPPSYFMNISKHRIPPPCERGTKVYLPQLSRVLSCWSPFLAYVPGNDFFFLSNYQKKKTR